MKSSFFKIISVFLLFWFPVFVTFPAFAQDWPEPENGKQSDDQSPDWEDQPSSPPPPPPPEKTAPNTTGRTGKSISRSNESAESSVTPQSVESSEMESAVQNAVIEGVQLSSEPSSKPDEKQVSCYFIFRDKPTSYFYEIKIREKKLIFEFNDTRVGASPVPSASEPPIRGFTIEQRKVDVNKEVRGLKPEWHDMIRVVFDLENVPQVHVNDEYSIISFTYKWTNDPGKVGQYIVKDKGPAVIIWSTAGIGALGLGVLGWFLLKPENVPPPPGPIPFGDLPEHKL